MNLKLRDELNKNRIIILLSLIAVLSGAVAALVGELFAALSGATLAIIFLLDRKRCKPIYIANCVLLVAINVGANIIYGEFLTVFSIEIVLVSLILAICYKARTAKSFCAALITSVFALLILASIYLYGAAAISDFSLSAVMDFYSRYLAEMREGFIGMIEQAVESGGNLAQLAEYPTSYEELGAIFDAMIRGSLSILIILSFALAGVTLKLFSLTVGKLSDDGAVAEWRFITSNVYAYFYIIIAFVSIFIGSGADILSIAVNCMFNVFTFVFAYVGFLTVLNMLNNRFRRGVCWLILIAALLMLSSLAIQILSYFGAFTTIAVNKARGREQNK